MQFCVLMHVCMYVRMYVHTYIQVCRDQAVLPDRGGCVGGDPDTVLPGGEGTATDEALCRP